MIDYDFQGSPGYWIVRTARSLERAMQTELAPTGITWRQWQVLAWLASEGGVLPQRDLVDRMGIESPSLARLLDRMERDGWIVRSTSPDDGRRKIVRLTDRVEGFAAAFVEGARRVRSRATAGLEPGEVGTLLDLLGRVRAGLDGVASGISS